MDVYHAFRLRCWDACDRSVVTMNYFVLAEKVPRIEKLVNNYRNSKDTDPSLTMPKHWRTQKSQIPRNWSTMLSTLRVFRIYVHISGEWISFIGTKFRGRKYRSNYRWSGGFIEKTLSLSIGPLNESWLEYLCNLSVCQKMAPHTVDYCHTIISASRASLMELIWFVIAL